MSCNPFLPLKSEWNNDYTRPIVSLKDKGNPKSKYTALNSNKKILNLFRVDGNIITAGNKCDYLLLECETKNNNGIARFIELKGSDINHAALQIKSTIDKLLPKINTYHLAARIILNKTPAPAHRGSDFKRLDRFLRNRKGELAFQSRHFEENI